MRTILITNAKGGCGKSTIATNLAAYYAHLGYSTALADYDPQGSALAWVADRPAEFGQITPLAAHSQGLQGLRAGTEYLIIDAPAGIQGKELGQLLSRAESVIVPVLPSPVDMKAAAAFIGELRASRKVSDKRAKVAVVANRVRENTLVFAELDDYLASLKIPYLTALRDAQNYVRAYQRGLGIHELPPYLAWPDWDQWEPIIEWLASRRSRATVRSS